MKNYLFINLKRIGDIYNMAHVINSLTKNDPQCRISVLVFEESKKALYNLKNIHQVFTIDRNEVLTFKKNDLYSDAFSLNSFVHSLSQVREHRWDKVVNYSNDLCSAYICSYLTANDNNYSGIRYSNNNCVESSDQWADILNDLSTTFRPFPIQFVDLFHRMCATKVSRPNKENILFSEKHNQTAKSNFDLIRKNESHDQEDIKLVGIQLKTSRVSKDIPLKVIKNLINLLLDTPGRYPVIIIAPNENERSLAMEINQEFSSSIATVEADLLALPSVLNNIDLLVTPDTAIKHLADLCQTPCLEISLGAAPLYEQATRGSDSYVLTYDLWAQDTEKDNETSNTSVNANDIFCCIEYCFYHNPTYLSSLSTRAHLLKPYYDSLGVTYKIVHGSRNYFKEIDFLAVRELSSYFTGDYLYIDNMQIKSIPYSEVLSWCSREKDRSVFATRDLLGTLRSLKQIGDTNKSSRDFIISLEKLLNHSDSDSPLSIAFKLFRTKIENLPGNDFNTNIQNIENLLYDLKDDIQSTLNCFKRFEEVARDGQREITMQKTITKNIDTLPL